MRGIAIGFGYAASIATAAVLFYLGYTHLLNLRSDALAIAAAALCGAGAGAAAWPGQPDERILRLARADLIIGGRTALLFYVLFTIATVAQRFPDYFGAVDGVHQTIATLLLSLPGLVVASLGVMIYASMGAAFFLAVPIARFWVRQARRLPVAAPARLPPHPPAA